MKVTGIIPSRYQSVRFPGKPLIDISGKTMIRRVYEQASKSNRLSDILVATDDERIFKEVESFDGKVVMTSSAHRNGTERCAEIAADLDSDYILNIQGDEPFLHPGQIDELISICNGKNEIVTLMKEIRDSSELDNPNVVKVTVDKNRQALYFSRQCIPHTGSVSGKSRLVDHTFWKHIGIYGYRADILKKISMLPTSGLEIAESLEQLRWLENGYGIKLNETQFESSGIDSPEDLERIISLND